jgi:hypothetical protein
MKRSRATSGLNLLDANEDDKIKLSKNLSNDNTIQYNLNITDGNIPLMPNSKHFSDLIALVNDLNSFCCRNSTNNCITTDQFVEVISSKTSHFNSLYVGDFETVNTRSIYSYLAENYIRLNTSDISVPDILWYFIYYFESSLLSLTFCFSPQNKLFSCTKFSIKK